MGDPPRTGLSSTVLDTAMGQAAGVLGRIGAWTARRHYWTVFVLASVVVVLKSGFKWAGTTGEGWFIQFRDVIDAWPLQEGVPGGPGWQENWAPIAVFRGLTELGVPYDSATWNLIHIVASVATVVLIGVWVRRTYGDDAGRLVAILVLFGAAAMVLLQEIGRYDSFFFLGAVMVAVGRRWWTIVVGALLLGASAWGPGLGTGGSLVLVGLVLGSRGLVGRGALALGGCVFGAVGLMALRAAQGGDPSLARLTEAGAATGAHGFELRRLVYITWNNVVQPFPNWIWAALGLTWVLFALVVLQSRRRRVLLAAAILVLPFVAGMSNASDGTRDLALAFTAVLLGAAGVLQRRAEAPDPDTSAVPLGMPSPVVLGLVVVVALIAPVVDINPHTPLNPYQWLSDYGLSYVYSVLG